MAFISTYKSFVMNDMETFNKIYNGKFNSAAAIKFNILINGFQSFFFYDAEIMKLVQKIKEEDNKIKKIFDSIPESAYNQYLRKSMIDEIEYTNQIEGVISTRKEINDLINEIKKKIKTQNRFEGIVNEYLLLMEDNKKIEKAEDIRTIYDEMLLSEISKEDKDNIPDGILFRKNIVHVYNSNNQIIHNGITPEDKIIKYINESLNILNDKDIDILIRSAIFHYLLAYIHPFYDGNGRINRFISSYILKEYLHNTTSFRLSISIKENITEYYDAFKYTNDIRNRGDISTFVYGFLDILYKSYQKTEIYVLDKMKTYDYYNEMIESFEFLNTTEMEALKLLLSSEIFGDFGVTRYDLQQSLNVGNTTSIKVLSTLKKLNLYKEYQSGRYFYYSANLDELDTYDK